MLRPFDFFVIARYRKTALFRHSQAILFQHHGIDQNVGIVFLDANVRNQQAFVDVHLGSSKSDAGCCVHGLKHIVDQLSKIIIHLLDRARPGAQFRIGKFENSELCHLRARCWIM